MKKILVTLVAMVLFALCGSALADSPTETTATIRDDVGKKAVWFDFPWVIVETTYTDKVISHKNGITTTEFSVRKTPKKPDQFLTMLSYFIASFSTVFMVGLFITILNIKR